MNQLTHAHTLMRSTVNEQDELFQYQFHSNVDIPKKPNHKQVISLIPMHPSHIHANINAM